MKKVLLFMLLLTVGLTANAQKYTVRKAGRDFIKQQRDSIMQYRATVQEVPLFKAGHYLKKAEHLQLASLGLGIFSGIAYSGAIFDQRSFNNTIGTVFAIGAVTTYVFSITYKIDAGRELEVSAGRVKLSF